MINSIIYAVSFSGVMMLYNFAGWKGNVLGAWFDWMESRNKLIYNAIGLCDVCTCFWFGSFFLLIDYKHYFIFLGISEMILIFYHIIILHLNK